MYHMAYQTRSYDAKEKVKYLQWTSQMDLCLTRILVEQVKRGNKTDNALKPAAYMAALAAVNEKFGLNLTKEHIRNRLKTLRKQFGVLKELFAQKGFEWDEKRKMIVADGSVWNEYIKAHPDARQFRGRSIENFDELSIILGNDQAAVGCSDNDAETDMYLTPNKDGLHTAIFRDIQTDDDQTKNLKWTEAMDSFLCKILVEQVQKGYKIDNILQCEAFDTALSIFKEMFGPDLTKDHIKNRLETWKRQYEILKELLSHPGFQWDKARKMVIGNDLIWDCYVMTNPDARIFRTSVVENSDDWSVIFGNDNDVEEAVDLSHVKSGGKVKEQVKNLIWTNEMDCCLSEVLVEQVKLCNRSKEDNKLKSAAYVAALSALNQRFQLDLTKENVRNRLRTWKKQYEILKEILNHSDFEWDETQKMVKASGAAWNKYIRRNPDARLFQGQVIRNYNELCVIFGYDDSPGSSPNCNNNNAAEEPEDTIFGQNDVVKEKGKYISWTNEMDRCLTEQLIEQVLLGNKVDKSFKPVAFRTVLSVLNKKFSLDLTTENIRNRLKTWKKQYKLVEDLLSHHGFEWDERQKMVIADDSEWNDYIKRNPAASRIRSRPIENYTELRIIVGNEQASSNIAETDNGITNPLENDEQKVETPFQIAGDDENDERQVETPLQIAGDDEEMHHVDTDDNLVESSQQTGARPTSSSHSKQAIKRGRPNDVMLQLMGAIAANVGRIADALTESNKSVCLDELFGMVQTIPDFDDDLIIDACEYLSFDEKRARLFMTLDERLRKKWLLKRLRGQNLAES